MELELIRTKHWYEVTSEEWSFLVSQKIINGCGGKDSFRPPEAIFFKADCTIHDFGYWQGYIIKEWYDYIFAVFRKLFCDWKFFTAMLSDSFLVPQKLIMRPYYCIWSILYFIAVVFCGWKFFQFRKI